MKEQEELRSTCTFTPEINRPETDRNVPQAMRTPRCAALSLSVRSLPAARAPGGGALWHTYAQLESATVGPPTQVEPRYLEPAKPRPAPPEVVEGESELKECTFRPHVNPIAPHMGNAQLYTAESAWERLARSKGANISALNLSVTVGADKVGGADTPLASADDARRAPLPITSRCC